MRRLEHGLLNQLAYGGLRLGGLPRPRPSSWSPTDRAGAFRAITSTRPRACWKRTTSSDSDSGVIYAHREDAPEHVRYAEWLRTLVESSEPFALSETVLAGFLRIATNPRIFDPATPMETAIAFCQRLVDWPRASLVIPGGAHWSLFTKLGEGIRGPLVADAYLAALAIEHGCELIATDADFARFPGLRWRHPLAAPG